MAQFPFTKPGSLTEHEILTAEIHISQIQHTDLSVFDNGYVTHASTPQFVEYHWYLQSRRLLITMACRIRLRCRFPLERHSPWLTRDLISIRATSSRFWTAVTEKRKEYHLRDVSRLLRKSLPFPTAHHRFALPSFTVLIYTNVNSP